MRLSVKKKPRLTVVMTADHGYTFENFLPELIRRGVEARVISWERVMRARHLWGGGWVLTDFDRLSPSELEVAGLIATRLREEGVPVLNDPLRFRPRGAFLAALRRAGLNAGGVWWPAAGEWPDEGPLILRTSAAHRGPIGDVIDRPEDAAPALEAAIAAGHPLADLLFVRFKAEPTKDGLWQKHAAWRVGPRILRANTVNETSWAAKEGTENAAPPEVYARERAEMDAYPHESHVRAVFDLAGQDFGRMDFGLIGSEIATYEINTNPYIPLLKPHPNPDRMETMRLMVDRLVEALASHAIPDPGHHIPTTDLYPRGRRPYHWRPRRW